MIVRKCPICQAEISLAALVGALPAANEDDSVFGRPGRRWIVHQAGRHVHFAKELPDGGRVDGYAYVTGMGVEL